ncbi:siphovirus ReqiPepy6 Gp37-like family protein [Lactococcus protaetiae]|uniref:Gp28/Gp37-like domain-containing protein n=1 Tax=Lactococcus protaetiae TaxID=2592653 RepID=A0A514Z723_9LACT|nr:siphovirus ReqiPepy6 Gp37-like family protein [Lactococcus protaetiae]QDK70353.1 hypothetical protein FLP15_03185 [Lactococcus protaetiae]
MSKELVIYQRIKDFEYEKNKVFDGMTSLIIYENYGSCDTFELDLPELENSVDLFAQNNGFKFDGVYYYVDDYDGTEGKIKVCGKSLGGKYDSRTVDRIYTASKSPALIVWDHFNQEMINPPDYQDALGTYSGKNRKLDYLSLAPADDLGLAKIDYQDSYDYVSTQVESLCQTYDFGFREVGDKHTFSNQIQIYRGNDVSSWVKFSDDVDGYENLTSTEFEHTTFDEKTSAHVFGEGDGANRVKVIVNPNLAGLERKELAVDARDLQSTDTNGATIPATTYRNMLIERGKQKLADQQEVLTLNGEFILTSKLVKFGRDFFVGDRVKLESKRYGVSKVATITQAKHTYDATGEHIELNYDHDTPTVFEFLGRK